MGARPERFRLVSLLDTHKNDEAKVLFAKVRSKNNLIDGSVAGFFSERRFAEARDWLNGDINFWIIQEDGHSQPSGHPVLLEDPDRLKFLQQLARHRRKLPSVSRKARRDDALVADILKAAAKTKN